MQLGIRATTRSPAPTPSRSRPARTLPTRFAARRSEQPFQPVLADEHHRKVVVAAARTVGQRMLGVVERGAGKPLGPGILAEANACRGVWNRTPRNSAAADQNASRSRTDHVQRRVVELVDGDAAPLPGESRKLRERAGPSSRRLRRPEDLGHGMRPSFLAAPGSGRRCRVRLMRAAHEVRLSAMALEFLDLGLGSEHVDYQRRGTCSAPSTPRSPRHPARHRAASSSSVYTAGKRTEPQERPLDGTPVIDVDRGGKITWHGPGQLVGYPIVRLPESVLVVDYVRRLEEAMIACSRRVRPEHRSDPRPLWRLAGGRRPAARAQDRGIGVRVAAGTTMHGFAINVDPDLRWFDRIIPCGLTDVGVTSMAAELGTTSRSPKSLRRLSAPAALPGL